MFMRSFMLLLAFVCLFMFRGAVAAQDAVPIQCGSIIEGEFIAGAERHEYTIDLKAGTVLRVSGEALGETLRFTILALEPSGRGVAASDDYGTVSVDPQIATPILSANGNYKIWVGNTEIRYDGNIFTDPRFSGGSGVYTIFVGCTLRDGTVIEPGDTIAENTDSGGQGASPAPVTLPFTGNGFPGLAPVDFTNAFVFPLSVGQVNPGQIPAGADAVISYTFDAQAGQTLDLTFTRTSGNLNLGLVVLNAENKVVFQASVVSANRVNAQLTLPTSGTYTIGVFRIDLLPPASPEATGFQIEAVLG
jgi:hypothetical protein